MQNIIALAEQAMVAKDWPEAVKRWQKVFVTLKDQTPAEAYVLLSMAHRFQGKESISEKIISQGMARYPDNISILAEHVEVAQAGNDHQEVEARLGHLSEAMQRQESAIVRAQSPLGSLENIYNQSMQVMRWADRLPLRRNTDQDFFSLINRNGDLHLEVGEDHHLRANGIWVCTLHDSWKSLHIRGRVFEDIESVSFVFNDTILSTTNVIHGCFSFLLNKAKHGLLSSSKVAVISNKGIIPYFGRHDYWMVEPPFVSSGQYVLDIQAALDAGCKLSKKGEFRPKIIPWDEKLAYHKTCHVLSDLFMGFLGNPVFISHGTLLGLYRDGEIIPHDDDFDCFYLSGKNTAQGVVTERLEILKQLYNRDIYFYMSHTGHIKVNMYAVEIDLMPAWIEEGTLNIAGYTSMDIQDNLFEPYTKLPFADGHVLTFAKPEIFLEHQYGKDWRIPDPGYFYSFSEKLFRNQRALWPTQEEMQLCMQAAKRKCMREGAK